MLGLGVLGSRPDLNIIGLDTELGLDESNSCTLDSSVRTFTERMVDASSEGLNIGDGNVSEGSSSDSKR